MIQLFSVTREQVEQGTRNRKNQNHDPIHIITKGIFLFVAYEEFDSFFSKKWFKQYNERLGWSKMNKSHQIGVILG